jgi:hypothetical protein
MKRDLKPVRDKLRADKRCQRLYTLFQELPIYQLPIDDLVKEIEQIHSTRSIRFLSQSSPRFIEAVVDASLLDQSNRSRLTEISMKCFKAENTLTEALEPLKSYLLMTYAQDLAFIRTKDERTQVLNMALFPFVKFIGRVQQVRTLANLVVEDIDKGAWSLVRLIDSMKLKHGRGEQTI